jgi:hypothetical protein
MGQFVASLGNVLTMPGSSNPFILLGLINWYQLLLRVEVLSVATDGALLDQLLRRTHVANMS